MLYGSQCSPPYPISIKIQIFSGNFDEYFNEDENGEDDKDDDGNSEDDKDNVQLPRCVLRPAPTGKSDPPP